MLAVADVLDVVHHFPAQSVLPHHLQHLSVHEVVRPEAVGKTTVASGEVFADVESFTCWLLATNLFSAFSLITFAYLQRRERESETKIRPVSATHSLRIV